MHLLKRILQRLTPKRIKDIYVFEYRHQLRDIDEGLALMSYSQQGEDLVLNRYFNNKSTGYYIDIGAHHPKRFSNTAYFYKKGWHGINIDANFEIMRIFDSDRKRDINLALGVSLKEQVLKYYCFNDHAVSTFDESYMKERIAKDPNSKVIYEKEVQTYPLRTILDNHLPKNMQIDFFNIDVEGLDLDVLKSNNWKKYRPTMIVVEEHGTNHTNFSHSPIYKYLLSKSYLLVDISGLSLIFKRNDT